MSFGYLWKVHGINGMFWKVRNIQRNILEGSGVEARRGTMRHLVSWAPPWPVQGRGEESPSKSDWWRWTPTPPPPRRHERGRESPTWTLLPRSAEGGRSPPWTPTPPEACERGRWSPTWTPPP